MSTVTVKKRDAAHITNNKTTINIVQRNLSCPARQWIHIIYHKFFLLHVHVDHLQSFSFFFFLNNTFNFYTNLSSLVSCYNCILSLTLSIAELLYNTANLPLSWTKVGGTYCHTNIQWVKKTCPGMSELAALLQQKLQNNFSHYSQIFVFLKCFWLTFDIFMNKARSTSLWELQCLSVNTFFGKIFISRILFKYNSLDLLFLVFFLSWFLFHKAIIINHYYLILKHPLLNLLFTCTCTSRQKYTYFKFMIYDDVLHEISWHSNLKLPTLLLLNSITTICTFKVICCMLTS